jgi:hypothetical protein
MPALKNNSNFLCNNFQNFFLGTKNNNNRDDLKASVLYSKTTNYSRRRTTTTTTTTEEAPVRVCLLFVCSDLYHIILVPNSCNPILACVVGPSVCEHIEGSTDFSIQTQFFTICFNFLQQQNLLKNQYLPHLSFEIYEI